MIYAANLKCNHTRKSFENYVRILQANIDKEEVFVFPPFIAFKEGAFKFTLGAQNFYPCESGSFTGEIGAAMLEEFSIKTVLIGHSERRELLKEDEKFLQTKFAFAKEKNWKIIYCIGENLATFQEGKTKEVLAKQIANIDLNYENLILAYEPIWAIGSGKVANKEIIKDILDFLREKTKAPLLYGGSVNEGNIKDIKSLEACDGVLIGSASYNAENFIKIIKK